ncbi:hypothetical protein JCM4814A_15500 [Streptomyces phaeofaciens JCM 4814]|uniref:Uncharacterized protein n=1 Tax=Streptomyces phaeofaciens TaxID=68254 RepID=A0A918HKI5_9ACTN|nr:hypothetical protein [Streptomyces phaeofaciens]GGT75724.1 hypothetical protein GCM10010226_62410 [Streptomyces phaeofaciens]
MTVNVPGRRGPQGPSPLEGERIRPLSRWQIEDRLEELGDLYAETSGGDPRAWNQDRELFLRRLVGELHRPGFTLLVAERSVIEEPAGAGGPTGSGDTSRLAGCAYGFPVRAWGPWWRGLDGYLPQDLLRLAASGRLFAVSGLVVHSRVRNQNQGRDWNLARRLQRRLLADHAAGLAGHPAVLGVTLVDRDDHVTLRALRAWGWRSATADTPDPPRSAPCRALIIGP